MRRILNLATTLPFNLALVVGGIDIKIRVNDDDIALAKLLCCEEIDEIGCSETFQAIAFTLKRFRRYHLHLNVSDDSIYTETFQTIVFTLKRFRR